ncbi:MAG: hypothetical protein M1167_04430 [Chloroflexi bacterium]|nr:hypothetical protein [Chloroflexota bacterium]
MVRSIALSIVTLMTSMIFLNAPFVTANLEIPSIQWTKTYGPLTGYSVIQTIDGGYAMVGNTAINSIHGFNEYSPIFIKTNSLGEVQLTKTFSTELYTATTLLQTNDSGYVLSGYGGWLLKLDTDGNIQWNRTYGVSLSYTITAQTNDGGFLLAGWLRNNLNHMDTLLIRTDKNGLELWNKTLSQGTSDLFVYGAMQTDEGGFALTGIWWNSAFWLAIMDPLGNLLENQYYNVSDLPNYSQSFAQTIDGGYILAGGDGSNAWLVKTDSSGNEQWRQSYEGYSFGFGRWFGLWGGCG